MKRPKKSKSKPISDSIHRILRPAAVAELLGIPVRTAQYLVSNGIIPSVAVGLGSQRRHRGVTREHIRQYLVDTQHRGGNGEGQP